MASSTSCTTSTLPESCDYLVVGAGATGMAFCDTLLRHTTTTTSGRTTPRMKVILVDRHPSPGGQWNDSYAFVQLHQPSHMYGVETEALEPRDDDDGDDNHQEHRATRKEILEYYSRVRHKLEQTYDFAFWGNTTFDFSQISATEGNGSEGVVYRLKQNCTNQALGECIVPLLVRRKLVDARYLEPDLPIVVPPKFSYNPESIRCIPVNALSQDESSADPKSKCYYVVIGAGKTGMDAVTYLLQHQHVEADHIWWIVPHDAWITARERMGSCLEFLHACTKLATAARLPEASGQITTTDHPTLPPPPPLNHILQSPELVQKTFLQWEQEGRVYRLNPTADDGQLLPTKFKDATLSKEELALLQTVPHDLRGCGRIQAIHSDTGALQMENGTIVPLPWAGESDGGVDNDNRNVSVKDQTIYVHCSAGAFNYTKQQLDANKTSPPLVFDHKIITIQDVYGTPGFCFVGSVIGKLESLGAQLTDATKNAMCQCPQPDPTQAALPLGPSGGDIQGLSNTHGYVQRLSNLKQWLAVAQIREWLVGHRLFNLKHMKTADDIAVLVDDTWTVLEEGGLVGCASTTF